MQRHERMGHTGEDVRGEMQAGGRRGNSAGLGCVDGLVAHFVVRFTLTVEIGRKRQAAHALEVDRFPERHDAFTGFKHLGDRSLDSTHQNRPAKTHPPARLDHAFPGVRPHSFQKQQFRPPVFRENAGGNDAGIVEHHEISGPEELGEFTEPAVLDAPFRAEQDHHPRIVAPRQRMPRNERFGKRVIVVASKKAHPFK